MRRQGKRQQGRRQAAQPASPLSVPSHLIVTATLALTVFLVVVIYGFWRNGLHFLNLFVPKGVPKAILPAIVFIEVLSFLSRPVS